MTTTETQNSCVEMDRNEVVRQAAYAEGLALLDGARSFMDTLSADQADLVMSYRGPETIGRAEDVATLGDE